MSDTVTTESHGHPDVVTSHQARRNDRDHGSRKSSGPAAIVPHQQAGHMTEADQIVRNVKKELANRGRPHMTVIQHTSAFSRRCSPEACHACRPAETSEGAGNAGGAMRPQPRMQK